MTTLTNFFAAAGLAAITIAAPAFAEQSNAGSLAQAESLTDNTLKAFAYDWYARFDNGASIEALAPNLPDSFEFVYPQATVTSLDAFAPLHQAAQEGTVASAHDIEEIYVHPTFEDDLFEIVTPHTYLIARKDGTFGNIDIVSRMRVRLGLVTDRDPEGALPKIENYVVMFEGAADDDVSEQIAANRIGDISDNDVKSFVHQWFAAADARDADAMIARTSVGALNINLLGTEIASADDLRTYLEANSAAQIWAAHQPHNISIRHTKEGFAVRFIVHFEGEIEGVGPMRLTNVTNWLLIEEDGELRLRDYTLTIL
ncbi:hypothetical protein CLV78_113119 [Aliiruegeria haliotis]|uniref:SnoaL-like protein n=1 Tax=Aliiruegeria haliotis TaxID=1280846 RepID=A0A2T0RHD7_9RHOB|nr:hypothetical protein [Aliiruegeria haliotis]PRY20520.1 hypothetical protein CLV78_113119 [Aliiruegeria haliotis]